MSDTNSDIIGIGSTMPRAFAAGDNLAENLIWNLAHQAELQKPAVNLESESDRADSSKLWEC